jgi:plasmid stabilization system protein ParE
MFSACTDFWQKKTLMRPNAPSKRIREAMKLLQQQPGLGRPAEHMEPQYRERIINFGESGYMALYRFDGTTAVILAIRHQREVGY